MRIQSLGQEEPLEKEMAIHSSILAWEIPRTEEPGGLQSMGPQRVRMTEHAHTSQILYKSMRGSPSSLRAKPICMPDLHIMGTSD